MPGASLRIYVLLLWLLYVVVVCYWWYVHLTNAFSLLFFHCSLFLLTSRAPQQDRSNRMSKVMEMVLFGTVGVLVNSRL